MTKLSFYFIKGDHREDISRRLTIGEPFVVFRPFPLCYVEVYVPKGNSFVTKPFDYNRFGIPELGPTTSVDWQDIANAAYTLATHRPLRDAALGVETLLNETDE